VTLCVEWNIKHCQSFILDSQLCYQQCFATQVPLEQFKLLCYDFFCCGVLDYLHLKPVTECCFEFVKRSYTFQYSYSGQGLVVDGQNKPCEMYEHVIVLLIFSRGILCYDVMMMRKLSNAAYVID